MRVCDPWALGIVEGADFWCREGWNELMGDYEVSEPACVQGATFFETDCGSSIYARVLFVSWNIISMYIFVSMVGSVVAESVQVACADHAGGSSFLLFSRASVTCINARATL